MEVSLSLSGGGYRAAAYHLGVLSYLSQLRFPHDEVFLDRVNTISGISGGALVALYFSRAELHNDDRKTTIKELFHLIKENNIAQLTLSKIDQEASNGLSVIQCLAAVYDDVFFKGGVFSEIIDGVESSHLHHVFADATDFGNGLPFRFQASRTIVNAKPAYNHGVVGNFKNRIPLSVAKKIRLADILASSSCFPIAFEPILFPNDFVLNEKDDPYFYESQSFGLMDGGIVDNQGVDPVIRTERQLSKDGQSIDVIILSDVASLDIDGYVPNKFNKLDISLRKLLIFIRNLGLITVCLSVISCLYRLYFLSGFLMAISYISFVLCYFVRKGEPLLSRILTKRLKFDVSVATALHVRLDGLWRFIVNRFKSAYIMVDGVMMGNVRRKTFDYLYGLPEWRDRLILNAEYMLKEDGTWSMIMEKQKMRKTYKPSDEITQNTEKASSMPTTLWFTKDQIDDSIPEAIFACGQYSICWNLLCFINKLNKMGDKIPAQYLPFLSLKKQLLKDWSNFKDNPQIMVKKFTE